MTRTASKTVCTSLPFDHPDAPLPIRKNGIVATETATIKKLWIQSGKIAGNFQRRYCRSQIDKYLTGDCPFGGAAIHSDGRFVQLALANFKGILA